jgi:hypothetical protein
MRDDVSNPHDDLGCALRGLPLLAPPRSAWPALERELQPQRRRVWRSASPWLALAAVLALFALVPAGIEESPIRADRDPLIAAADPEVHALQALMHESAQLEQWIAWSQASAVESAPDASLGAALGARLQQIDSQLANGSLDRAAHLQLWQERVLWLRQLAHIENTQQLLAARGESDSGLPVQAF